MDLIIQNIRNTNRKGYQKIIEIIQSIEPK